MNILLFIIYPLLALLLFFKAGFFKKDSFNEEYLGLSQTKALLGFFSICIILHHVSQKPASFEYAALAPFRTSGYLFVSFFFFCSGYGLLKGFSSKPDYLKGFLNKRYLPLLITSLFKSRTSLSGKYLQLVCICNHAALCRFLSLL